MIKNRKILLGLFILLCSNKCAKEGTSFHIYNRSENEIFILSNQEIIDLKNGYITKSNLRERIVKKSNDGYIGFIDNDLKRLKNNRNEYNFYFLSFKNNNLNDFMILDSIKINANEVSLFEIENCIYYDYKSIIFINKN